MKIRTLIIAILGIMVVSSVLQATEDVEILQSPSLEPVSQESTSLAQSEPATPSVKQKVQTTRRLASASTSARLSRSSTSTSIQGASSSISGRGASGSTLQRPSSNAPARTPGVGASRVPTQVKIFKLRYAQAEPLAALISDVLRIEVHPGDHGYRLIVNATAEQMQSVEALVQEMDVPETEPSKSRDVRDFVYRIYMFEIPSGDEGLKPFSMTLQAAAHVPSQELLEATADDGLQISEFLQSADKVPNEILIQGKAASNESLMHLVERIPKSHITELKWDDDETFTDNVAAAQYTQLPDQMQKHINKFLGEDIRTVGYWFGNLSIPGEVDAPIGPWTLNMSLDTESDHMLELGISVVKPSKIQPYNGGVIQSPSYEILSNKIRTTIGKPIIIGYNRESYGTRKMGAMVIVPEADPVQSDAAATNPDRF